MYIKLSIFNIVKNLSIIQFCFVSWTDSYRNFACFDGKLALNDNMFPSLDDRFFALFQLTFQTIRPRSVSINNQFETPSSYNNNMDSIINEIVIKSYHMQYFLTIISQLALYRGLYMTMEKAAYKKLKRVTLSVKCLFISQKSRGTGSLQ